MFDQLQRTRVAISQRVAVLTTVLGAFGLGLATGKLLAGWRPFDWTLEILDMAFMLGITIWFASAAMRNRRSDTEG